LGVLKRLLFWGPGGVKKKKKKSKCKIDRMGMEKVDTLVKLQKKIRATE